MNLPYLQNSTLELEFCFRLTTSLCLICLHIRWIEAPRPLHCNVYNALHCPHRPEASVVLVTVMSPTTTFPCLQKHRKVSPWLHRISVTAVVTGHCQFFSYVIIPSNYVWTKWRRSGVLELPSIRFLDFTKFHSSCSDGPHASYRNLSSFTFRQFADKLVAPYFKSQGT